MMPGAVSLATGTALAVAGLVLAEARGSRVGVWVAKPLASTGFVALAWTLGAADTAFGRTILVGLVACWLGDVLLIPKGARSAFVAGLVSFLLGHLVFAAAFLLRGSALPALVAGGMACALVGFFVLRWVEPHLPPSMKLPVRAYVLAISLMVACAAGAAAAAGPLRIAIGAVAFAASDVSVVRERFVQRSFVNKAWGLPLYYAAQLLLASSVGVVAGS